MTSSLMIGILETTGILRNRRIVISPRGEKNSKGTAGILSTNLRYIILITKIPAVITTPVTIMKRKARVIASLAPSFVAEFPGLEAGRLIHALRELGFWAVSETALGAEEVSAACAELLSGSGPGTYFSTACPTVVELIRHYHADHTPSLTRLVSPLLAHCKLLQREFGEDIGIVFIGPCISKKLEADAHPELLDVLTFADLRRWLEDRGIAPAEEPFSTEDVFVPKAARDGALYPADGGMNRCIAHHRSTADVKFMAFSGIRYLQEAMEGLDGHALRQKVFLELLACEGT